VQEYGAACPVLLKNYRFAARGCTRPRSSRRSPSAPPDEPRDVLGTLVGVVDRRPDWSLAVERRLERVDDELGGIQSHIDQPSTRRLKQSSTEAR
jgi:hypothetical protein